MAVLLFCLTVLGGLVALWLLLGLLLFAVECVVVDRGWDGGIRPVVSWADFFCYGFLCVFCWPGLLLDWWGRYRGE